MTTTVKTDNGRKLVSTVEQSAEDQIRKIFAHTADIWDLATRAAGLHTELGIPAQGERHLIASWAGVRAAIRYASQELRDALEKYSESEKQLRAEIDGLREKLDKRLQELREKDSEVLVGRIEQHFSRMKGSSELLSIVCEEVKTGA